MDWLPEQAIKSLKMLVAAAFLKLIFPADIAKEWQFFHVNLKKAGYNTHNDTTDTNGSKFRMFVSRDGSIYDLCGSSLASSL